MALVEIDRNMDLNTWRAKMKDNIAIFAIGNGFLPFLFELREDRDVVFRNGTHFLGSWRMY